MSDSPSELDRRRRILVMRSERLRGDLGRTFADVETRLGGADKVFAIARGMASPSLLLSLAGMGLGLLRRTHPFRWATRGLVIFSLVRRILSAVRTIRGASPPARR